MKTKICLSVFIVAACIACNKNKEINEPIVAGQEVTLTIGLETPTANVPARKITGTKPAAGKVGFTWNWTGTEKLVIEQYDKDIPSGDSRLQRAEFTLTQHDASTAKFEGTMPLWYHSGDVVRVIAGDYEHLLPTDHPLIELEHGGVANNAMRFEAITSDLQSSISLSAVWGAFYIPFGVQVTWREGSIPVPTTGTGGEYFDFIYEQIELWDGDTKIYTYDLNHKSGSYQLTSGGDFHGFELLYIAAPITYNNLIFKVVMDLTPCTSTTKNHRPVNGKSTFAFSLSEADPITLERNKYIPVGDKVLCPIEFERIVEGQDPQ